MKWVLKKGPTYLQATNFIDKLDHHNHMIVVAERAPPHIQTLNHQLNATVIVSVLIH